MTGSLFDPLQLRGLTLANRIALAPMCQYSAEDGFPNDWHFVHLVTRALGGAGLVITEATAVEPRGRISPQDLGIWSDEQVPAFRRLAEGIAQAGAVPGIQLAHAGRKASTKRPWEGRGAVTVEEGGWEPVVGPSAIRFAPDYLLPDELDAAAIEQTVESFRAAARRARQAGFRVAEVHGAHGYLLSSFLSPLANHRRDTFGGSLENRARLLEEVVRAVRSEWPEDLPLFVRISTTDWTADGWSVDDSVVLAKRLSALGVDLIDCSSGGNVVVPVPTGPGYQTAAAARIRREALVATGAVGLITEPTQADHLIRSGQADLVLIGRAMLREPYWPLRAARELGAEARWPVQYLRAKI